MHLLKNHNYDSFFFNFLSLRRKTKTNEGLTIIIHFNRQVKLQLTLFYLGGQI